MAITFTGCSDDGGAVTPADGGGSQDAAVASLTREQLIDACVRASACGVKTYPGVGSCLASYFDLYRSQGFAPIYDAIYTCINAAKGDCDLIAKCYGRGGACDSSYKASCNGTVASSCDLISKRVFALDCAKAKMICKLKTSQAFAATCTPKGCDSSYSARCEGRTLMSCDEGALEPKLCEKSGLNCGYGGYKTKSYACQGETSDKCTTFGKWTYKASCSGNTALACVHDRVHREDCSQHKYLKTRCEGGTCLAAGKECTTSLNRCSGTKLETCLDGTWKQIDCATLGLGPCKQSGTYGANCSKTTI